MSIADGSDADRPPRGPSGRPPGLLNLKTTIPKPFAGDGGMSWRDWSYRVKTYIQAVSPELRHAMETVKHRPDVIPDAELSAYKIDMATSDALK